MGNLSIPSILIGALVGLIVGVVVFYIIDNIKINSTKAKAKKILDDAQDEAKNTIKQAVLDGKTQVYDLKLSAEKEIKDRKSELQSQETKLLRREDSLNFRDENLTQKERKLDEKLKKAEEKAVQLNKMEEELQSRIEGQITLLERVSNMSQQEAHDELMQVVEKKMQNEVAAYIREKEEEAKAKAKENSREIIATAIQRYSQEESLDRTISVVALPSEEMKGRIIGREGRNIRAIEQATGVDLIIDDTPEAVILSSFDPIRREVARIALEKLIVDGRIHPARIEEMVEKAQKEVETMMREEGEAATLEVGVHGLHPELVRLLGKMRFRTSYGQNALKHSIEVAHLSGLLAGELGLDVRVAKRAGLLHDIGKSIDHDAGMEGSHVSIGVDLCRKYKESATIINAVEAHHGDVAPQSLIACIVQAADAISAARPGARRETLETYTTRLKSLEDIANGFKGVDKTFAIQAGREIRVMVVPEQVTDADMVLLARDISKKIESELEYPGTIKVNLIRESRVTDYAK